jgi:hypothetical protein
MVGASLETAVAQVTGRMGYKFVDWMSYNLRPEFCGNQGMKNVHLYDNDCL